MATIDGPNLAYLTTRETPARKDGTRMVEVGAVGHGPAGAALAEMVSHHIRTWNQQFRDRTVRFELPNTPPSADPASGRFVLERPHRPITVIWE